MARARRQSKSKHIKRTTSKLESFFDTLGWAYLDDFKTSDLDHYIANSTDTAWSKADKINSLTTFFARLNDEGTLISPQLRNYSVFKPASRRKFTPWEPHEEQSFTKFMVFGMEILAAGDPSWTWHERILRFCYTKEFQLRMRLFPFFLGVSRMLTRYTELCRTPVANWNSIEKSLAITSNEAKTEPKLSLADDESAWLYSVMAVGRQPSDPLFQSPSGKEWCPSAVGRSMSWLFGRCGLKGKFPYEFKFTGSGKMYDNPDQFSEFNHEERLRRVRAISGHAEESASVERYIKARWGNSLGLGSRIFYNKNRIFPFKVDDFPVIGRGRDAGSVAAVLLQ